MFLLKNIFVIITSSIMIALLIVIFNQLGMNKNFNLLFSGLLYGVFVTIYFKTYILSLSCFGVFYGSLFLLTSSYEVIEMLAISCIVLFVIKMVMPQLKNKKPTIIFFDRKQKN